MIRSFVRSLLSPPSTEMEKLLADAHKHPRYKDHTFTFGGMTFHVTDFLSVAYQLKEYFEDEQMKFNSETSSPVIYDCGSNVGVSVIYYKKLFPNARITAFEPDPKIAACLRKNLSGNTINDVSVIDKAVWINNDGIEFGSEGADGGSVFFQGNKITVPSVRLRDYLEKESRIDCLKMDIEGAEATVMEDCKDLLNKIRYLFVEYHSWKKQAQDLDRLLWHLKANGFRYYIRSIGEQLKQPFLQEGSDNPMDIQLDIHAINCNPS